MNDIHKRQNQIRQNIIGSYLTQDELLSKAIEADLLVKGKKANLGEIREWNGKKVQKTTTGWKPVGETKSEGKKDFSDYSDNELQAYIKNTGSEEAKKELRERAQKVKGKVSTDDKHSASTDSAGGGDKGKERGEKIQNLTQEIKKLGTKLDSLPKEIPVPGGGDFWSSDSREGKHNLKIVTQRNKLLFKMGDLNQKIYRLTGKKYDYKTDKLSYRDY